MDLRRLLPPGGSSAGAGSWALDGYDQLAEGRPRQSAGEVHFGWTLEGRAVQDVWIAPPRSEHVGDLSKTINLYGTTLRVWDPAIQAWRVYLDQPGVREVKHLDWAICLHLNWATRRSSVSAYESPRDYSFTTDG